MAHTAILLLLLLAAASSTAAAWKGSWVKMGSLLLGCPGNPQLQAARIWMAMPKRGHAMCRIWLFRESLELPLGKQQQPAPWLWGRDEEQATLAISFS